MPVLLMTMGPSYSGKSHFAAEWAKKHDAVILSSDAIRGELYGDENIQREPEKVFRLLHKRMIEFLRDGYNVVYDATNLVAKRRKHVIKMVNDAEIACEFNCVVCVCGVDTLLNRAIFSKRERKVPDYVIRKQLAQFQCPWYHEGWDYIGIYDSDVFDWADSVRRIIAQDDYIRQASDDHDNPNHSLSISAHMTTARGYLDEFLPHVAKSVQMAVQCHDIGKYWTKSFLNSKGEITDTAHFYNHENWGAYLSLVRFYAYSNEDRLYIAALITYHMEIFRRGEAISKFYEQFAQYPEFITDLKLLHACDLAAH